MGRLRDFLGAPRMARVIRFVLDECLPPIIRDRRWFYRPILWLYNPRMDPDFREKALFMSDEDFERAYAALTPMRATDVHPVVLAFVLTNLAGETVLEVGCGNGEISIACAQRGLKVTATDLIEENLEQARTRARLRNLSLDTRVANVERLPFEDTSFDTTLCLHTLEHVLDFEAAVLELKRVTRRRLIVVVPKERYYRYTCNYHVWFFGGPDQLLLAMKIKGARCLAIQGALCYVADLDRDVHGGVAPRLAGPATTDVGSAIPLGSRRADDAATANAEAEREHSVYPGVRVVAMFPFYNEENKLARLATRLQPGLVDRFIGVNDGSTDAGPELLRSAGIEVVDQPHMGAGACIKRAVRYARENGYDILVVMAGNNKDDPAEIPRLVAPIVAGWADYVQGSRFLPGGSHPHTPWFRLLAIKLLSFLYSVYMFRKCTDLTNGFRAYRVSLFDDPRINIWQDWLDTYEYEYYVHWKVYKLGYRFAEVPATKSYPEQKGAPYSKIRPISGWWRMLRPLVLLSLRIKK